MRHSLYRDRTRTPPTPHAPGEYFSSKTRVPLAFWRVAPNGGAPRITSRTGESCAPYTLSVAGILLYNPYSSRKENSTLFVAWQFARATSAVYGRMISPEAYAEASERNALPAPVTESLRVRLIGGAALMSFLLLLLWLTEIARRPSVSVGTRRYFAGFLVHLPLFAILVIDVYYVFQHKAYVVGPLLQKVLVDLSIRLPHNPAVFALYLLIPVLAMYALFEWQFARSETTERIAPPPA